MNSRSGTLGLLALVSCLAFSACSSAPEGEGPVPAPEPVPETYDYVALGDSYAALGSTGSEISGPEFCQRSADNYPSLVLADDRVTGSDVSCAGAVTVDVLNPVGEGAERIPAQIDALTEDVDLVTLSIGGNDIGFGAIVGCVVEAMRANQLSTCEPALRERTQERLGELPAELDRIHGGISARAPDARVIVTGYLPLIAPGDDCAEITALSEADRSWVIDRTGELNDVVEEAAQRNGADMVLPDDAGAHTGCVAPEQRWVDFFGAETGAYPMHPTPAGQEAMAEAVLARL